MDERLLVAPCEELGHGFLLSRHSMFPFLVGFSAISFVCYGISCLMSERLAGEFERFGLRGYRKVTGILQLLAAVGLLVGFAYPVCGLIASGGLALQMLLGFGVRLKVRDSLIQSAPALFYCALNAYLFWRFWAMVG